MSPEGHALPHEFPLLRIRTEFCFCAGAVCKIHRWERPVSYFKRSHWYCCLPCKCNILNKFSVTIEITVLFYSSENVQNKFLTKSACRRTGLSTLKSSTEQRFWRSDFGKSIQLALLLGSCSAMTSLTTRRKLIVSVFSNLVPFCAFLPD